VIDPRLRQEVEALEQSSLHTRQSYGTTLFGKLVLCGKEVPRAAGVK
jgi:hypothetical protein